jgi:AcrR family transcriptional regulator
MRIPNHRLSEAGLRAAGYVDTVAIEQLPADRESAPSGNDRRRERTRRRMLDAGVRLVGSGAAPEALGVTDVVAAAGVGAGSFYTHFGDMPTFLAELANEGIRRSFWTAIGESMPESQDPAWTVAAVVWRMIAEARRDQDWARFTISMSERLRRHDGTGVEPGVESDDEPSEEVLTRRVLLDRGLRDGSFGGVDAVVAERAVVAVVAGLMRDYVMTGFGATAERDTAVVALQALGVDPTTAAAVAADVAATLSDRGVPADQSMTSPS